MKTKGNATKSKAAPRERMLVKLKESGLAVADAKLLKLLPCTEAASVPLGLSRAGEGFKIPYYDLRGELLPMFRYRYFDTEITSGFTKGEKLRKYDQPPNTPVEIYLPQITDWENIAEDPTQAIVLTEGELKSACATKLGFPTIGLGGVFSFGAKHKYQVMLPSLKEFKWSGRDVFVCFDSDAVTNKQVLLAEVRLAKVLTDLSASVRVVRLPSNGDKKMGLDDYLVKHGPDAFEELLDKAPLFAPYEAMHALNAEVVYVEHPSMVVQYPREDHPKGQPRYRMMRPDTFKNEVYADRKYVMMGANDKLVERKAAAEWMEWAGRAKVDSVVYSPGEPNIVNGNQMNMWEGWGAEPVKGDVSLWRKLLDNVFHGADPLHRKWFEQWVAWPIQHPGAKLNTAVVVWSFVQGNGKTLLGYTIGKMYGNNFAEVPKTTLESSFNEWAVNKQFVLGDEITGGSGREVADALKYIITGAELSINQKYVPSYTIKNCINLMFTSNHPDAFFMSNDDRRHFIHEITGPKPSNEFFAQYDKWYKTQEAVNALFYYFKHLDTTGFNPMAEAPHTASRKEMIEAGKSEHAAWISELKEFPDNKLRVGDTVLPFSLYTVDELLNLYQPDDGSVRRRFQITGKAFGIALKEAGFKQAASGAPVETVKGRRQRVWIVRESSSKLEEAAPKLVSAAYVKERAVKGAHSKKFSR